MIPKDPRSSGWPVSKLCSCTIQQLSNSFSILFCCLPTHLNNLRLVMGSHRPSATEIQWNQRQWAGLASNLLLSSSLPAISLAPSQAYLSFPLSFYWRSERLQLCSSTRRLCASCSNSTRVISRQKQQKASFGRICWQSAVLNTSISCLVDKTLFLMNPIPNNNNWALGGFVCNQRCWKALLP